MLRFVARSCECRFAASATRALCRARLGPASHLVACEHAAWVEGTVDGASDGLVEFWLSRAGSGLREFARGNAVLHGSAISRYGVGVSLVGASGTGKSTLAAWLCQRDWSFVSDAMTVVEPHTRRLFPQVRRIRLFDDSVRAMGTDPDEVPLDDPVTSKRGWLVPSESYPISKPVLSHVLVLERGEDSSLSELAPSEASMMLVVHAYLASNFDAQDSARLLRLAGALVSAGTRVYRLSYPRIWNAMPAAQNLIDGLVASPRGSEGIL